MDLLLIRDIALGGVCSCVALFVWKSYQEKKNPGSDLDDPDQPIIYADNFGDNTSLSEVSVVWTSPVDGVITLADMSILWRAPEKAKVVPIFPIPDFIHPEMTIFWTTQIEPRPIFSIERKYQVAELLKLLDTEGCCSSVVRKNAREVELSYDPNSYEILSRIELWDHSLRVAELMIEKVKQTDIRIPDAVLLSLGHDLGKIPEWYDRMYKTGDHPILAKMVLDKCVQFQKHPKKKEMLQIIAEHHLPGSEEPMAKLLRECDTEARQMELIKVVKKEIADEKAAGDSVQLINPRESFSEELPSQASSAAVAAAAEEELPAQPEFATTFQPPPGKHRHQTGRKAAPPPEWLDADKLRVAMRKRINCVQNGNWEAVSMSDGIIWYRYNAIVDVLREASDNDPTVLGLAVDRERMSDLILSVFKAFGNDCVAWGLMGEGYSATKCLIESDAGKMSKSPTYLTPVKASWFFTTPSALDSEKTNDIRRMVKRVIIATG